MENEKCLSKLVIDNADGIVVVDKEGRVLFVNPAAEVLFGRTTASMVGTVFGIPVNVDKPKDISVVNAKGEPVVAEMLSAETQWDGASAYVASFRDITGHVSLEEELMQTTSLLEAIFTVFPARYFLIDAHGVVLDYNTGVFLDNTLPQSYVANKTLADFFPPDAVEKLMEAVDFVLKDKFFMPVEFSVLENELEKNYEARLLLFLEDKLILIIRDISDFKRAEKELSLLNQELERRVVTEIDKRAVQEQVLLQKSRLAAMGEMIGAIAHQWRQPLTTVGLLFQEIKDAYNHGELTKEHLNKVISDGMNQIIYMSKTIDDFRNFYTPSKEKQNFNIVQAIKETISVVASQLKNNYIGYTINTIGRDDIFITSYKAEFMQVVINIISNAKGAIIGARRSGLLSDNEGHITIGIISDGNRAKIMIKDNGGGIPSRIKDRIFEPYFTTKNEEKGMGIGLYMSKIIIERNMGGELYSEDIEKGAIFTIELPIDTLPASVDPV
ncbi:MAG: PAS domain-containing sensor histidine kinase [Nitrospirae bacterium]|nr:PAS domain-containing sensor histidine kinase [Nitrospirota bacterium]